MAEFDPKSKDFFRAINEASEEQKSRIIAEVDAYREQQLAEAERTAAKRYEEYILAANEQLATEDSAETAQRTTAMRKSVTDARAAIEKRVFDGVAVKLKAFTESDSYEGFIIKSVREMLRICGGAPIEVFIREKDLKFSGAIKQLDKGITLSTDSTITIGGVYCVCPEKSIKLNDLLETRLENQRSRFYENSGLTL